MKRYFVILISLFCGINAWSQSALGEDTPFYLPGDGVYLVGLNSQWQPATPEPTMVAAAYQTTLALQHVDAVAARSEQKPINMSGYISEDGTLLDLSRIMGIGEIYGVVARNVESGESYQLGDYAPARTWQTTRLWASNDVRAQNNNERALPLCMYDQWDCPITCDRDPLLAQSDVMTVDFGCPHEGLVAQSITLALVSEGEPLANDVQLTVAITQQGHELARRTLATRHLQQVRSQGDYTLYHAELVLNNDIVLNDSFAITITGWSQPGVNLWLARAIDTHQLYPSHTTYADGVSDASSDACVHVLGYFNYVGAWGWYDGKQERGEAYATGDLAQIYYDPSDPEWPGDYYRGEASFPVECTFGRTDIVVYDKATWMTASTDDSQWQEHGALQLIVECAGLPEGQSGRLGKIVFATQDLASFYTILIRQGTGWFDDELDQGSPEEGIDAVWTIPTQGGRYDLLGRPIATPQPGQIYIENGQKKHN